MATVTDNQINYRTFLNRESSIRHHRYDEEMLQYDLLRVGDMRAIEENQKIYQQNLVGHVSDDPLRNFKYLIVASITLATRATIQGGMFEEDAYNASDLFIQALDKLESIEECKSLNLEMFTFFTQHMATLHRRKIFSKPIVLTIDFILDHLHEKITVQNLAENIDLNPNYLSTIFKRETGMTISNFVMEKKIEVAKNMLQHSKIPFEEIAEILSFSSQSHFTKVFKSKTGFTPLSFRQKFFCPIERGAQDEN